MSQPTHDRSAALFAALAYILPLAGGIIALLAYRRHPLARLHAQQSIAAILTLVLSFLVWAALGYLIALIPGIGPIISIALFALVIALAIFLAINWLISLARALRGEERTIPLANRVASRVFSADSMKKTSA